MAGAFYGRYLELIEEIEHRLPVSEWKRGDLDIWPLARMDLYLDMYWAEAGVAAPAPRPLPLRIGGRMAMPLRNLWKTRRDLAHHVVRPAPAHAIILGDGVSLDRVDGAWRDRFGEPVIAALERRGLDTFLMQQGHLGRLPWHRPTYAANLVESRGFLRALRRRAPAELPGLDEVVTFLVRHGVDAGSLRRSRLERRGELVNATAASFEHLLKQVQPTLAFVVSYYAGLGPAFVLACRRLGILSIDLQRAPHGGALHAYRWPAAPPRGYSTLPAVFWSWTLEDSARVEDWTAGLDGPWHGAIHGGHTQLTPYLDDQDPATRAWDARFAAIGSGARFEREILVALQPIHGHRAAWDALCSQIEAAPRSWRWWIRRHPASRPDQDAESARLLALPLRNVIHDEASALPLPALLRHMSALVSLASGAAVEASMFGVPAFFLADAARPAFADLLARGDAAVIDAARVNDTIARMPPTKRRAPAPTPSIDETLRRLEERARARAGEAR